MKKLMKSQILSVIAFAFLLHGILLHVEGIDGVSAIIFIAAGGAILIYLIREFDDIGKLVSGALITIISPLALLLTESPFLALLCVVAIPVVTTYVLVPIFRRMQVSMIAVVSSYILHIFLLTITGTYVLMEHFIDYISRFSQV